MREKHTSNFNNQYTDKHEKRCSRDGIIIYRCHQQVNLTKCVIFDSGPFVLLRENMTSSTKQTMQRISHCHQKRTKPWS